MRNDRSYRPFAARKRAFRFVRVEQVREAGVRHGCHGDWGRLNPRSTLRPQGWSEGGSGSVGKSGKGLPGGVTMGVLSLEICREHAGWSVHCFNASFRWKTYRPASPSRKNSADTKLTRRRTTGVDGEYKSRHRVAITTPAFLSYSGFATEVYMPEGVEETLRILIRNTEKYIGIISILREMHQEKRIFKKY